MLISAREERSRRFKLALRAGLPIVVLISLLFYATFSKSNFINLTIENALLMGGLIFITIYFIYFLLELDVKETLLDSITDGFNQIAFIEKVRKQKPKTIVLLKVNNLPTIDENYGTYATNSMLHTLVSKLNRTIHAHNIKKAWIGRKSSAEILIALNIEDQEANLLLKEFVEQNQTIDTIELDFRYAILGHGELEPEKTISRLRDELISQELAEEKEPESIKDVNKLNNLEEFIVASLKEERVNLYFRPLLNVAKNIIDSYEVSIKLQSDGKNEILPREFLPVINRLGMGRLYDLAIFKQILETAMLTDDNVSYSFNLSPFSLRDRDFLESIFTLIEEKEVDPKRFIIQLYERKTHHNLGKYLKTLTKIRLKGLQISLDNFGSSNASLEYMKHFKFDVIQFDRDFVTNLNNPNNYSVLKSLVEMSKELHITTVAKWVDREDQKEKLIALGVNYIQGFGVGKQLTKYELIEYYN